MIFPNKTARIPSELFPEGKKQIHGTGRVISNYFPILLAHDKVDMKASTIKSQHIGFSGVLTLQTLPVFCIQGVRRSAYARWKADIVTFYRNTFLIKNIFLSWRFFSEKTVNPSKSNMLRLYRACLHNLWMIPNYT